MGASIFQSVMHTNYFAPFRYGDSIIPKQEQLVKSGPYFMNLHPIRSFYDVEFSPSMGGDSFVVDGSVFRLRANMREVIEQNAGHAVADLWIYADNPVLKVWRVDVGKENVLTYEEALKSYQAESETANLALKVSAITFICFIWSLISIKRTN